MFISIIKLSNKVSNCLKLLSNLKLNSNPMTLSIQTLFLSTTIIQALCDLIFL